MRGKWFTPVIIVLMLMFSAAVYAQLPDQVPSHWNIAGEADNYQPKPLAVLFLPVIAAFVWVIGRAGGISRFGQTVKTVPVSPAIINLIVLFAAAMHVVTLGNALGWQISVAQVITLLVGVLLVMLGNQMRRIDPNPFIGIRTPWTLRDSETWRKTHAYAGRLYFAAGLLIAALVLLIPTTPIFVLSFALIAGVSLWVTYYSYRIFQLTNHG